MVAEHDTHRQAIHVVQADASDRLGRFVIEHHVTCFCSILIILLDVSKILVPVCHIILDQKWHTVLIDGYSPSASHMQRLKRISDWLGCFLDDRRYELG